MILIWHAFYHSNILRNRPLLLFPTRTGFCSFLSNPLFYLTSSDSKKKVLIMRPILPPPLLRILLFLIFALSFVLGAPAASFQMTRRQTGQEHSYLIERLIADSSRSYRPRTRKLMVAGIGRRAIVKGTYGSKVVPRQNGASEKVSSSALSAAAISESVVKSQSDFSASFPVTEGLSQSLAGAGVTGSSTDMGQPSATGELSNVARQKQER